MLTSFDRGPGLYWREDLPLEQTGQTSGIAGFVGVVTAAAGIDTSGLVSSSHRLTRLEELEPLLAGMEADPFFQAAVEGFFQNGGRRCHVVVLVDTWSRLADEVERIRLIGAAFDQGLHKLEETDEIDLIAAPCLMGLFREGTHQAVIYALQQQMLKLCVNRGDCFAILDAPPGKLSAADLEAQRATLSGHEGAANGALYYPWVRVPGGCRSCGGDGLGESGSVCPVCEGTGAAAVPGCGHLAGIYARVDARVGVFRAPANEEIEGIIDLQNVLSGADLQALNGTGINLLRALPGRGLRVWGARTLSTRPEWQWISVRRLFLDVRRWLEHTMVNVVFEPNDFRLWIRIDRELTAYFEQLYRAGALKGRNAAEAFFVRCDEETNPADVQAQGQLVVEIGLAPAVPREYIVVRLVRGADGVSMTTP